MDRVGQIPVFIGTPLAVSMCRMFRIKLHMPDAAPCIAAQPPPPLGAAAGRSWDLNADGRTKRRWNGPSLDKKLGGWVQGPPRSSIESVIVNGRSFIEE